MCTLKCVKESVSNASIFFSSSQFGQLCECRDKKGWFWRRGDGEEEEEEGVHKLTETARETLLRKHMEQICRLAWATAATSHIPAKEKNPHNRFGLFKHSHPDKHLEDISLNK